VKFDAPKEGLYQLGVRYVQGKSDIRPAELKINNEAVTSSLNFSPTGAWTAWTTTTTIVKLRAGQNVIRLIATGAQGLVNIDHFTISPINK
jgi:hypothetical protein